MRPSYVPVAPSPTSGGGGSEQGAAGGAPGGQRWPNPCRSARQVLVYKLCTTAVPDWSGPFGPRPGLLTRPPPQGDPVSKIERVDVFVASPGRTFVTLRITT